MKEMQNTVPVVSREQRNRHARAIKALQQWKVCYQETSMAIRAVKQILRMNGEDRFAQIARQALSVRAQDQMAQRFYIRHDLRTTAYTWAPRELVEQARQEGRTV